MRVQKNTSLRFNPLLQCVCVFVCIFPPNLTWSEGHDQQADRNREERRNERLEQDNRAEQRREQFNHRNFEFNSSRPRTYQGPNLFLTPPLNTLNAPYSGAQTQLANPDSINCVEHHSGSLTVATDSNGEQYGICWLSDNVAIEEWCLYRADHSEGQLQCRNLAQYEPE